MLQGGVCCGAVVVGWSEIGRPSTTSVSAVWVVACDGAVLRMVMNTETVTTG